MRAVVDYHIRARFTVVTTPSIMGLLNRSAQRARKCVARRGTPASSRNRAGDASSLLHSAPKSEGHPSVRPPRRPHVCVMARAPRLGNLMRTKAYKATVCMHRTHTCPPIKHCLSGSRASTACKYKSLRFSLARLAPLSPTCPPASSSGSIPRLHPTLD